ncbi:hypothetical protein [Aquisalinus flavus]|uniref:Uncharacterized protein n=1 Tax=Aquisalinus flavus TaxID=1526572 RepID=A0A8J2V2P0_9PROT|nr:hypothetical protein [Aquisalinus flavus]MBD0425866.1 hypothetical protein [Aquisalinus flavus]UNE48537.1 hypothetical protein FF099_10990 [Aquisalinus flavus]GGD12621.1 hypothetical protein GCM10011342_21760 [Aquisalinus flavus]
MSLMKNMLSVAPAGLFVAALIMPAYAADPVVATTLTDVRECRTEMTSMTGKRSSCSRTMEIEAPFGFVLDPQTVTIEPLRTKGEVSYCGKAVIIYDGDVPIGVEANLGAMSGMIPNSRKADVKCRLSGTFLFSAERTAALNPSARPGPLLERY